MFVYAYSFMNRDSLFFRLLRIGLGMSNEFEDKRDKIIDNKCCKTFSSAQPIVQGVGAFIFDGLQMAIERGLISSDDVSREMKMKLFAHTMQVEKRCQKHEKVIQKLAGFYAEHGIRMMVLKGYGLGALYPKPNHRPCGDVDIWLFGEQERADRLLNQELGIKIEEEHQHHTVFQVDGVMVENHFEFVNVLSHRSNRDVERELRMMVNEGELIKDEKINNVYYPPVNFNALFLLRHAAAHFAGSEIVLRHVTDWAMFVKRYHKEIDWDRLECFAKEQNMQQFLHCLNAISIDCIGLPRNMFPDFVRNEKLEATVMEDILHPAFPERGDLRKCWWKNYIYTLRRWWGNRWKHRIVYREGLFMSFFVLLTSHYRTKPIMEKA